MDFGNGLVGGDDGQPTTETFVDFIASVVEDIYRSETALFKRLPLSDASEPCNGGDGKIDIYLSPLDMAGRMRPDGRLPEPLREGAGLLRCQPDRDDAVDGPCDGPTRWHATSRSGRA